MSFNKEFYTRPDEKIFYFGLSGKERGKLVYKDKFVKSTKWLYYEFL